MSEFRNLISSFAFTGSIRPAPLSSASSATPSLVTAVQGPSSAHNHEADSQSLSRKRAASPGADLNLAPPVKKARTIVRGPSKSSNPSKRTVRASDSSRFSGLKPLEYRLALDLDIVFCGFNPGVKSAKVHAHYGNSANKFWHCLHAAGFTSRLVTPVEEAILPTQFALGLTDLVSRPTAGSADLSEQEMSDSVPDLLAKIARYRPMIMCCVGQEIWDTILKVHNKCAGLKGRNRGKMVSRGIQPFFLASIAPDGSSHKTFFSVMKSTSPRVRDYPIEEKEAAFKQLHNELVQLKSGRLPVESFIPLDILLPAAADQPTDTAQ